ncbi:MAG: DUF4191 domain-containing protein [Candidatus Nanopelagicales bacterium]
MSKMGDRFRTIRENYRMTRKHDRRLGWILLATFAVVLIPFIVTGVATRNLLTWLLIGLPLTFLAVAAVFSRRAYRSAYKSIEGQPGAAVAVVQNMAKRGWGITPAVNANRAQDLVHRAVGRPGVVLIGEGTSPALRGLMATERKRTTRFVGEIPISELVIGNGADEIPIAKLDKHLRKMPDVLAPGEVTQLRKRLEALGSATLPIPKGPIPKSSRIPRGGKLR